MGNLKNFREVVFSFFTLLLVAMPSAQAEGTLDFICEQSPSQVVRPAYKSRVTGSLDETLTPYGVQVLRVLSQRVLAFSERGIPAKFSTNDSLDGIMNRFDVSSPILLPESSPTRPHIYYLDLPKDGVTSGSHFRSYLDVLFVGGTAGWYRFKLDCRAEANGA